MNTTHAAMPSDLPLSSTDLSLGKIKQVIPAMRIAEPSSANGVAVEDARSQGQGSSGEGQRSSGEGDAACLDGNCCEATRGDACETDRGCASDVLTQTMPIVSTHLYQRMDQFDLN